MKRAMGWVSSVRSILFIVLTSKQEREVIAKLASKRESPSAGSKHSTLRLTQRASRVDAVYNSRPYELTGPPVQIYHPAFTTFIKEISHPIPVEELAEELDLAVKFIFASLDFEEGSDRRVKLNNLKILGDLVSPKFKVDARKIFPDGTTTVFCPFAGEDAIVRVVELKNDIGEGGTDPIMQAECGFALICSSEMVTPPLLVIQIHTQLPPLQYKQFRDASCCPMFLIGVVGPHLAVSGAVFADNFISQRLTDYIYLGPLPTCEGELTLSHSIHRVAQFLRALKISTQELTEYYKSLQFVTPITSKLRSSKQHGSPPPLRPFPYILSLRRLPLHISRGTLLTAKRTRFTIQNAFLNAFHSRPFSREPSSAKKTRQGATWSSSLPMHVVKQHTNYLSRSHERRIFGFVTMSAASGCMLRSWTM